MMTEQEINNRIEIILDKIADAIIENESVNSQIVKDNQKTIRNGIISLGRENSERLVLYQKDIQANQEDLKSSSGTDTLRGIVEQIEDINQATIDATDINNITITFGQIPPIDITNLLTEISTDGENQTILNPLNVSQFLNVKQKSTNINVDQANEFLDTNIYELLPDGTVRQDRIDELFNEIENLLPPQITDAEWGLTDSDGMVDRVDGMDDWVGSEEYYLNNSISAPQNNEEGAGLEEEGFITRLNKDVSEQNQTPVKSIESLRNRLNNYLKDVDEPPAQPQDERPEYQNQSDGYLKFRNLNQGIIIRNTNQDFVEGLNPDTNDYLQTGFTITMWVRFLDKSSQGTLFNFGNPIRGNNPFGFKLETYVINGDTQPLRSDANGMVEGEYLNGFGSTNQTWKEIFQNGSFPGSDFDDGSGRMNPDEDFFLNSDSERFVRLVVKDYDGRLRGSHMGMPFMARRAGLPEFGMFDFFTDEGSLPYDHAYGLMTNTRIPTDFNEWYFICASFNPTISEDLSHEEGIYDDLKYDEDFWKNNKFPNFSSLQTAHVVNSGYGAKCKIEVISRTDLLRARGFKV